MHVHACSSHSLRFASRSNPLPHACPTRLASSESAASFNLHCIALTYSIGICILWKANRLANTIYQTTAANLRAGSTGIMIMSAPASSVETRIAMVLLGAIVGAMSMAAWDTASRGARAKARPSVTSITLSAGQFKVAQDEDKGHNPQLRRTDPARTQPCATPSPTSPAVRVPPEGWGKPREEKGWGYPEAIPKHIHQTWIDTSVPTVSEHVGCSEPRIWVSTAGRTQNHAAPRFDTPHVAHTVAHVVTYERVVPRHTFGNLAVCVDITVWTTSLCALSGSPRSRTPTINNLGRPHNRVHAVLNLMAARLPENHTPTSLTDSPMTIRFRIDY